MLTENSIKIILREAKIKDIYELRRCNKVCLPIYYPYDIYETFIKMDNIIVLVAMNGKEVIGYIIGENNEDQLDRIHIISFGVCENFRKKTIGTTLMNKIMEMASLKYKNVDKVSLYVMKSNTIARKFYEKNGFKKNKLMKNYYSFNEDGYLYIKNII